MRNADETAMLRVEIEEQPIVDRQHPRCGGTRCRETQHRIRAVAVVVDELRLDHGGAGRVRRPQRKP